MGLLASDAHLRLRPPLRPALELEERASPKMLRKDLLLLLLLLLLVRAGADPTAARIAEDEDPLLCRAKGLPRYMFGKVSLLATGEGPQGARACSSSCAMPMSVLNFLHAPCRFPRRDGPWVAGHGAPSTTRARH